MSGLNSIAKPDYSHIYSLTPREVGILKFMAKGLSNQQIALELSISPKTVRAHASSIYSKLGVQSQVQAVIVALQLGLATLDNVLSPEAQVILQLLRLNPDALREIEGIDGNTQQ